MNICFIGGGNMTSALIGGMLQRNFSAAQLRVVEINADSRAKLQQTFGVQAFADLQTGIADCNVIVLAVKPQQLRAIATQLAPLLSGQSIISIAAGIRATDLARWLGSSNIVRAMPNTPALIQRAMTGLYALPAVSAAQREQAQSILAAVGETLWLQDEAMLDALTLATASSERQRNFANEIPTRQIGPNVAAFGLAEAFAGRNIPDYALTAFGKPERETNCDCERATVPTLLQTLYTRNDPEMLARIESQREETPAWIAELRVADRLQRFGSDKIDPIITEIFLRTVSRPPTVGELQKARTDIAAAKDPINGVRDLLWAMLSTREFTVNH